MDGELVMTKTIEFWFDFGSPTTYLAHTQLPRLARECGAGLKESSMPWSSGLRGFAAVAVVDGAAVAMSTGVGVAVSVGTGGSVGGGVGT